MVRHTITYDMVTFICVAGLLFSLDPQLEVTLQGGVEAHFGEFEQPIQIVMLT